MSTLGTSAWVCQCQLNTHPRLQTAFCTTDKHSYLEQGLVGCQSVSHECCHPVTDSQLVVQVGGFLEHTTATQGWARHEGDAVLLIECCARPLIFLADDLQKERCVGNTQLACMHPAIVS